MTQEEIEALDDDALTEPEVSRVREVCIEETRAEVADAVGQLVAADRQMCRAYLFQYFDTMPHQMLAVHDGIDGKDYSNQRDRMSITVKMRALLGFPALPVDYWRDEASMIQARRGKGARHPFGRSGFASSARSRTTW